MQWAITIQNGNLNSNAVMDVKSMSWQWRELERENRLPERKGKGRVELIKTDLWLQSGPHCSLFWPRTARLDTTCRPTNCSLFGFFVPIRGTWIWNYYLNTLYPSDPENPSNNDTAWAVKHLLKSVHPKVIHIDFFTNIIQRMKLDMHWLVSHWWMS